MFEQYLTPEQRESIVSQRVNAHAQEGFQHEINLAIAQANGDDEAVAASQAAIDKIALAINVEIQALDILQAEVARTSEHAIAEHVHDEEAPE